MFEFILDFIMLLVMLLHKLRELSLLQVVHELIHNVDIECAQLLVGFFLSCQRVHRLMNFLESFINGGSQELKVGVYHTHFNLILEYLHPRPLCALIHLVFDLVSSAIIAFLIDSIAQVRDLFIITIGFCLRFLHSLSQSVNSAIELVLLSVELVTAEGLTPDQVHLLECLLLHFVNLAL